MKKLFSILMILFLITSCVSKENDISILEKSNCKFPCWNGIIVGETTEDTLLGILSGLPMINQSSIKYNKQPKGLFDNQILFSFNQNWSLWQNPNLQGDVDIKDNIVATLVFCGKINTTVNQLVELFGEPEYIISGNAIGGGRTVILIDSKNGISYWFTADLRKLEILPTTEVGCIHLFDLSFYEKMLDVGFFSAGYYNAEETMRVWYEWDGYGNLDEKYPPRQP